MCLCGWDSQLLVTTHVSELLDSPFQITQSQNDALSMIQKHPLTSFFTYERLHLLKSSQINKKWSLQQLQTSWALVCLEWLTPPYWLRSCLNSGILLDNGLNIQAIPSCCSKPQSTQLSWVWTSVNNCTSWLIGTLSQHLSAKQHIHTHNHTANLPWIKMSAIGHRELLNNCAYIHIG